MNTVLNRLKEIATAVMFAAEGNDLESVLERIAEVSRELAGTRYAALGIPDGQGGLRYFKTAGMTDEQMNRIPHLPLGKGMIGAIMEERHPIILNDMTGDSRSIGFPENHPPMSSFLGVPIQIGNQLFGMLYLTDKIDGSDFSDDDLTLIETMAGYAALAIAGAELGQQRGRLRLLEERERIGMELHDGIIQSLYGIGMQVELMRQDCQSVPSSKLGIVVDSLDAVIEDIRGYITELRKRGDSLLPTDAFIQRIVDRLHLPAHLTIAIDAPATEPPFTPATFESIGLIVNEAVSNAVRHAQASHLEIRVFEADTIFCIEIEDDGKGFDVESIREHSGLGLRNMMRRAQLYGGSTTIESIPGRGTKLVIEIPMRVY